MLFSLRVSAVLACLLLHPTFASIPDEVDKDLYEIKAKLAAGHAENSRIVANEKQSSLREKALGRTDAERDRNEALTITNEIQSLRDRIAKNEATRTLLKINLERLAAELTVADRTSKAAAAVSVEASNQAVLQRQELAQLEAEVSINSETLEQARSDLATVRRQIIETGAEADRLEAEQRQISARKEIYEDEQAGLRDRIAQLQDILRGLQKQCAEAESDLAVAQKAKLGLKAEIDTLTRQVAELEGHLQRLATGIEKANQTVESAKATSADLKIQNRDANRSLLALDIEKQRLEDSVALLRPAIAASKSEWEETRNQIAVIQAALRDAADKAPLEARLKELQEDETAQARNLNKLKGELKQDSDKQLEIPGQRAELKIRVLELEQKSGNAKEIEMEAVQEVGRMAREKQAKTGELAVAQRDCGLKVSQLPVTEAAVAASDSRLQELANQAESTGNELEYLRNRRPYLDNLISAANAALRIFKTEALPNNTQELASLTTSKATLDETIRVRLANANRLDLQKKQKQIAATEADRVAGVKQAEFRQAEAAVSALTADQARDKKTYAGLDAENQSSASTIKLRETYVATKSGGLTVAAYFEVQQKRVDEAVLIEKMAAANSKVADEEAKETQVVSETALREFGKRVAAYNAQKSAAAIEAIADANPQGNREGTERGSVDGRQPGTSAGSDLGKTEGESEGKNREFAKAFAEAQAPALTQILALGSKETPEQKAARQADATLMSAFSTGENRGKGEGEKDGLKVGDNAQIEAEGFTKGYDDGKNRIFREFDATHRPVGRKQRESEIRGSDPSEVKPMDPEAEPVAVISAKFGAWWIPDAVAANSLGEITADRVPRLSNLYRQYKDIYDHPDFVKAYRLAYDEAYLKSYLAAYQESYRQVFVLAHSTAYNAAKKAALEALYTADAERGTQKGAQLGVYEGLGYNAGKVAGFAKGQAAGEATARERGRMAGDKEGYAKNGEAAKTLALQNGRMDAESDYTNNVKLSYLVETQKLKDGDADGKFQIGERVSLSASIRNFGGVRAEKGDLVVQVDPTSVRGIQLKKSTVVLGEIEKNNRVDITNLLSGVIQPAGEVALQAKILLRGVVVAELKVQEAIYAPYNVTFTDATNPKKGLFVRTTGDGSGYQNAILVRSLGDKALLNDLTVSLETTVAGPIKLDWGGGVSGKPFVPLDLTIDGSKRKLFFLTAIRREGLDKCVIRVQLKNKAGQLVFDQVVSAPVVVTP